MTLDTSFGQYRALHAFIDPTGKFTPGAPGIVTEVRKNYRGAWEAYAIWATQHQGDGGQPITTVEQRWVPTGWVRERK